MKLILKMSTTFLAFRKIKQKILIIVLMIMKEWLLKIIRDKQKVFKIKIKLV